MSVIRFGVVGTNFITDSFLAATRATPNVTLSAVYSRTPARAAEFANKYGCSLTFTDLTEMARCSEIDAVYIASPTSLHAEQSVLFLSQQKHVFCEKPVCSNVKELDLILACAAKNNVAFLEAMRPVHCPNFDTLSKRISSIEPVRSVLGVFCQLSSRYGSYLRGERPNAFLSEFSNGALMDLGCYLVHATVALFGPPSSVQYVPVMLDTGVDASGTLVLQYDDNKIVTLLFSKQSHSFVCSEIQGEKGTLSISNLSDFAEISFQAKGGVRESLGTKQDENTIIYELATFCRIVRQEEGKLQATHNEWSRQTMLVLDQARRSAHIVFPADKADLGAAGLAPVAQLTNGDLEASPGAKKPKL